MDVKETIKLNRCRKNIRRDVGHAISDFSMIADGDLAVSYTHLRAHET